MKKIVSIITLIACSALTLGAQEVTKSYKAENISGICAGEFFEINVTQGDANKIEITGPSETMAYLSVRISEGILTLDVESKVNTDNDKILYDNNFSLHNIVKSEIITSENGMPVIKREGKKLYGPVTVNVTSTSPLKSVYLYGCSKLTTDYAFSGDKIVFKLMGNATLSQSEFSADKIDITMSGASVMALSGSFNEAECDLSGATNLLIDGRGKRAREVEVSQSGSSKIDLNTSVDELEIDLSGSSRIILNGEARKVEVECTGSSSVESENFTAGSLDIELTGSSKISMSVLSSISGKMSGSSLLTYDGTPDNINISKKGFARYSHK